MRKFFLGLMLSSALGAVVIGGALAWTGSSNTFSTSATAGGVSVVLTDWAPTGTKVIPTGLWINVGTVGFLNNGDVTVHATGGSVTPTGASIACVNGGAGSVVVLNPGNVAPAQQFPALVSASLWMPTGADNSCQSIALPFDLNVTVAS